jgi:hypothetical protein
MPLKQQYLLDLIAPPVLATLWWFFSRGTATVLQGGSVSQRTKRREKIGFLVVLTLAYLLMFGGTAYLHFAR